MACWAPKLLFKANMNHHFVVNIKTQRKSIIIFQLNLYIHIKMPGNIFQTYRQTDQMTNSITYYYP